MQYSTEDYLELLDTSYKYIYQVHKRKHTLKQNRQLQLHIFSFSQIVYALYCHLCKQERNDAELLRAINKFFRTTRPSTPTQIFNRLGNDWKHDGITMIKQVVIQSDVSGVAISTRVRLPIGHTLRDVVMDLVELSEQCAGEITSFYYEEVLGIHPDFEPDFEADWR